MHRAVLVRFPHVAQRLKPHIDAGYTIARLELALDYHGHELDPEGYLVRLALGAQKWKDDPPRWHVVAWALKRPWIADGAAGPTFNAHVKGAGHWAQYGAGNLQHDRHPARFGPAELSVHGANRGAARLYAEAARSAPSLPERDHLTRQAARVRSGT